MGAPRLILPSDVELAGQDSRLLARLCNSGRYVRVRRGVYAEASEWQPLDGPSRYGLRAIAFQLATKHQPVFCRQTAALLWGLWTIGTPQKLHVLTQERGGGRSRGDIARHFGQTADGVVRCGPLVLTDKLTTTMELITRLSFERAVAVCDSSLHAARRPRPVNVFTPVGFPASGHEPVWRVDEPQGAPLSKPELLQAAESLPSRSARNRAVAVIGFASGLSGSAGESLSRVRMGQLGFAAPELQHRFTLRDGSNAFVDFWFEQQRQAGEFDGRSKYLRRDWAGGTSIQDRIMAEKNREDQIRAQDVGVFRWTWQEMMDLRGFERLLRQAGIPQG
ncbi:type IV toxin-antitoxin system AbiEi family antitoxin domain-containing protein [Arthrobacter sp. STN4]|uniref:type IV toxin-antitoxin system AbiEi family antitoxin domain-containing protein n=1 Tax=Arthrobacter sp. STN4 TaxID=2923276 RepID=UPI002119F69F|nr:type IV toxin-antitoxin system AbiEi family antitoxin domain-containing protein [Arthrobacter sp. STN4]MCQ9164977.1 type IV toxin-antitoxin system AbiEi family antitoxin domain-containing protein [Arthrobacter sp. STN4]